MITSVDHTEQKKSLHSKDQIRIIAVVFTLAWIYLYKTAIDHTDWWIENILVILFFAGTFCARKKFSFSNTAIVFICLFLLLHLYGAEGAYTHNQFGEFLKHRFQLQRNPYDRIVHFSFGFLMMYPIMEILKRKFTNVGNGIFLIVNTAILCLATIFELIEWGVAAFTDKATGETYVATQGDPWDAQKDIILAVLGSILFTYILKFIRHRKSKLKMRNFP